MVLSQKSPGRGDSRSDSPTFRVELEQACLWDVTIDPRGKCKFCLQNI